MLSELDVIELYRCLLGREPEDAATISAFRHYYPTLAHGRRAILASGEFAALFADATGRPPPGHEDAAGRLALALLDRAAAIAQLPPPPPADPAIQASLAQFFSPAATRLAVAVGHETDLRIDDLIPLGLPECAILHVAPNFPPVLPVSGRLQDGTAIFRLGADAQAVAQLLGRLGRRIDALYLLNRPAGPHWAEALRPHFGARLLLAIGRDAPGFDAGAVSAAVAALVGSELAEVWEGLRLYHLKEE
jgi:hypothetical protein